jgi:hypothetical protein
MRTTTIACDRCSTEITGGHSIVEVKHGDLVRQFDQPLDLCQQCCSEFLEWLRGSHKFELAASEATASA